MFKKILMVAVIILLLLAAFIGLKVIQADKILKVEKTATLDADIKSVYSQAYDLKNWTNWSSWDQMDPNMKKEYSSVSSGVGANYSWVSEKKNVGEGSMTITDAKAYESINYKMDFGEEGTADASMTFTEVDGGTKVTWDFESNEEASKFQNAMFSMLIGQSFTKSLKSLEKVAAEAPAPGPISRISDIEKVTTPARMFLGMPYSMATDNSEEMTAAFAQAFPKVMNYVAGKNSTPESMPAALWKVYDEETNKTEFLAGMFVNKSLKAGEGMLLEQVPAGNFLKATHYGAYENEDKIHYAIAEYAQKNDLEIGMPISIYANDPTTVKPEDVATEVWYSIVE